MIKYEILSQLLLALPFVAAFFYTCGLQRLRMQRIENGHYIGRPAGHLVFYAPYLL